MSKNKQHALTFSELDAWDKIVEGYPDESTQKQPELDRLYGYRHALLNGKEVLVDELS